MKGKEKDIEIDSAESKEEENGGEEKKHHMGQVQDPVKTTHKSLKTSSTLKKWADQFHFMIHFLCLILTMTSSVSWYHIIKNPLGFIVRISFPQQL